MEKYIIDRIEGPYAVCEGPDKAMRNIRLADLPDGAKEGVTVIYDGTAWHLDRTEDRTDRIRRKMDSLWR